MSTKVSKNNISDFVNSGSDFSPSFENWVERVSSSEDEEVSDGVRCAYESNMNHYQKLSQKEGELLLQMQGAPYYKDTLFGLKEIAERKLAELNTVLRSVSNEVEFEKEMLSVCVDAEPHSILNKYLKEIKIRVNEDCLQKYDDLSVRAHLVLTPTNTVLKTTSNRLQNILQGRLVLAVRNGIAKFDRLKIMEVSSKYQFQNFALVFQLETKQDAMSVPVGVPVMSSAFQVLSRNKRKVEHAESSREPKKKRCRDDSKYVDITALLVLPQKEAAAKLGISESMLCKRFKESTRRKWPYRYLKKIEKTIKKLEENEEHLPHDEKTKLDQLREERMSCLQPIRIRVTGRETVQQFPLKNLYSVSTFNTPLSAPTSQSSSWKDAEHSEDDELDSMAQVLQNLKSGGIF